MNGDFGLWNISDRAKDLHDSALVWDNHVCMPQRVDERDMDYLEGLLSSGINTVHINIGDAEISLEDQIRMAALYRYWISLHPDKYILAKSAKDIRAAKKAGKTSILFDVEGMYALDDQLSLIKLYYDLGVRWMLIAYNLGNKVGGGCHDKEDQGITKFGYQILDEMARVGMIVDCSHTGYRTAMDVLNHSPNPVNFSHSNPRALIDHPRNIPDELIMACAKTGGVIGINGLGHFLGGANAENMLKHIDYCVQMVGADHVGIGTDHEFDSGSGFSVESDDNDHIWPPEHYPEIMPTVPLTVFPELTEGMIRMGYPETAIRGILGENWLRVAEKVWK